MWIFMPWAREWDNEQESSSHSYSYKHKFLISNNDTQFFSSQFSSSWEKTFNVAAKKKKKLTVWEGRYKTNTEKNSDKSKCAHTGNQNTPFYSYYKNFKYMYSQMMADILHAGNCGQEYIAECRQRRTSRLMAFFKSYPLSCFDVHIRDQRHTSLVHDV